MPLVKKEFALLLVAEILFEGNVLLVRKEKVTFISCSTLL